MNRFVILGGGTAGWLSALTINKLVPYSDVTVISSEDIGIIGAGEGTTPPFKDLMNKLDVPIEGLYKHAKATTKAGINYVNWHGDGTSYIHPFWNDQTALHFDASLLATHLRGIALSRGIKNIDGIVAKINSKSYNDDIESFDLESGENIPADFVFDCSGLHRVIIGKHYKSEWLDYSDMLPCNRAIPFFLDNDQDVSGNQYTDAIAMKHGWIWRIPVQGRFGCGYVFDQRFVSDEDAIAELKEMFGDVKIPRVFDFRAGCYKTPWMHNCIAVGLSSGFMEPLEATSIWIQAISLLFYVENGHNFSRDRTVVDAFNEFLSSINKDSRDFIHAHYLTRRNDTDFWKTFREKNVTPDWVSELRKIEDLEQYHVDYVRETYNMNRFKSIWNVLSWKCIFDATK